MRSDPGKSWAPRLIPLMTSRFQTTVHSDTLNNVTITPHIAGSTIDAFSNSPKLFAEILLKKLS